MGRRWEEGEDEDDEEVCGDLRVDEVDDDDDDDDANNCLRWRVIFAASFSSACSLKIALIALLECDEREASLIRLINPSIARLLACSCRRNSASVICTTPPSGPLSFEDVLSSSSDSLEKRESLLFAFPVKSFPVPPRRLPPRRRPAERFQFEFEAVSSFLLCTCSLSWSLSKILIYLKITTIPN